MNFWRPVFNLTSVAFLCIATLHGEEPTGKPRIHTRVEFVEVDVSTSRKLLSLPRNQSDDSDLLKQVRDLTGMGKARIVEVMMGSCPSGGSFHTGRNSVDYPESFYPPELPKGNQSGPASGPNPIFQSSQPVGPELNISVAEFDPKTDTVRLTLAVETSQQVGEKTWFEWRNPTSNADVKMPVFYDLSCKFNLRVTPGQPLMAAALTPQNKEGRPSTSHKLLVFVTSEVVPRETK